MKLVIQNIQENTDYSLVSAEFSATKNIHILLCICLSYIIIHVATVAKATRCESFSQLACMMVWHDSKTGFIPGHAALLLSLFSHAKLHNSCICMPVSVCTVLTFPFQ